MVKRDLAGILGVTTVGASTIGLGQDGFTSWEMGSVVFLVVATAGAVVYLSRDMIIDGVFGRDDGVIQRAEIRDAKHIFNLARKHLGENVTGVSQIKSLIEHSRDIFWVLLWEKRNTTRVCGYYCIIPMSELMKAKADRNELNILMTDLDEIPKRFEDAAALYFGGIVGDTYSARPKLLTSAEEKAQQYARVTSSCRIYARAETPKGLHLMKKREFAPVVSDQCGLKALFLRELDPEQQKPAAPEVGPWPLVSHHA